jgi:hypothetical protein
VIFLVIHFYVNHSKFGAAAVGSSGAALRYGSGSTKMMPLRLRNTVFSVLQIFDVHVAIWCSRLWPDEI